MLDDVHKIRFDDKLNVLESTEQLHLQCSQAWNEVNEISLPAQYRNAKHIVLVGMGGSHLGGNLIQSVFKSSFTIPFIIESDYNPPSYVGPDTLVIACSYSGTTEEVLSFAEQSLQKKAMIFCISSGNHLQSFAQANHLPHYTFNSQHNASKIPRYGSGYMFLSLLAVLTKLGFISIDNPEVISAIDTLKIQNQAFGPQAPTKDNLAKQMALHVKDKSVVLIASEHLIGSAYIFKNQINESAKNFSTMFEIPDLNHHLLEGLANPKSNQDSLAFMFFGSDLYHPRNQRRHSITQEIITKQGISVHRYLTTQPTSLTQAFEVLAFTSYVALYLSILNHADPGPNPWVDYLKNTLGQSLGK